VVAELAAHDDAFLERAARDVDQSLVLAVAGDDRCGDLGGADLEADDLLASRAAALLP
jgi:hypothetical protein